MSGKNVSPQNGGFIRAIEHAPRLFIGRAKPVLFSLIDKNLSSSQRNLLDNFLSLGNLCRNYWIIRFEQYR